MTRGELSLWRGTRRLGDIYLRQPRTPELLGGVLLPVADIGPLPGVFQRTLPPGTPMRQTRVEATLFPATRRADEESSAPREVAFPLTYEPLPRVEPDDVFFIREASGEIAPFDAITITELRLMPGSELAVSQLPPEAVREGSMWMIRGDLIPREAVDSR